MTMESFGSMSSATASMTQGLNRVRVLIVEDEPFIAIDIQLAVQQAGGEAVGPAPTIKDALELIRTSEIQAAILDVNLPDGHIGPVLQALGSGVAIVVHTGVGLPPEVEVRFPSVPVYTKPTAPELLVQRLVQALRR